MENQSLRISAGVIIILFSTLWVLLYHQADSWRHEQARVEGAHHARVEIEMLDRRLREVEAAQRLLLLYPKPDASLEREFDDRLAELQAKIESLSQRVGTERVRPSTTDEFSRVLELLSARLKTIGENRDLLAALEPVARTERLEASVRQNHAIHDAFDALRKRETQLTIEQTRKVHEATSRLITISGLGSALGIGVLLVMLFADRRNRRARRAYQRSLSQARDAAVDSVRTTMNFVASVSHEIRTPMNGIIGSVDLLQHSRRFTEDEGELVQTLRSSCEALHAIINDILDLSKLQVGKMDLVSRDFQVREALDEVMVLFAQLAEQKDIDLACWIAPEVPSHIRGDRQRLKQIAVNLLSNAIKFTSHGGVLIEVVPDERNAGTLMLRVTDSGPGISPEDQKQLFKPFSRVNAELSARHEGTGLGLAICHELARRMGGDLSVTSEPGRGSCFLLELPYQAADASASTAFPSIAPSHLIIVESGPQTADVLTRHGQAWGMDVTVHPTLRSLRAGLPAETPTAVLVGTADDASWRDVCAELDGQPVLASAPRLLLVPPSAVTDSAEPSRHGVTRRLRFPLRASDLYNQLVGKVPAEMTDPAAALPEFAPQTVVLVEDNPINQRIFTRQLAALGLKTIVYGDGPQAITARQRNEGVLMLMDCQLPTMDGPEATRRIRAWEESEGQPRLPVIAITAQVMPGDAEACYRAGMDDHLPKPVELAKLHRTLARWLPASPLAQPVAGIPLADRESELLDLERFDECLTGDAEADAELLELSVQETLDRLREMREALTRQDGDRWQRAAHRGKGACATLGFTALARILATCEAVSVAAPEAEPMLAKLRELLPPTRRAAEDHLSERMPQP